jgi:hypothetical protein
MIPYNLVSCSLIVITRTTIQIITPNCLFYRRVKKRREEMMRRMRDEDFLSSCCHYFVISIAHQSTSVIPLKRLQRPNLL